MRNGLKITWMKSKNILLEILTLCLCWTSLGFTNLDLILWYKKFASVCLGPVFALLWTHPVTRQTTRTVTRNLSNILTSIFTVQRCLQQRVTDYNGELFECVWNHFHQAQGFQDSEGSDYYPIVLLDEYFWNNKYTNISFINIDAFVLVIHMENNEVYDLSLGCIYLLHYYSSTGSSLLFSSFLFPNSGKMLQTTASVFVVKIGGTSNSSIFRKISDKLVNKLLIK